MTTPKSDLPNPSSRKVEHVASRGGKKLGYDADGNEIELGDEPEGSEPPDPTTVVG